MLIVSPLNWKSSTILSFFFFFRFYLFIFRERGRERERQGEKHQCVFASHGPLLGTWSATQACALNGIELVTLDSQAGTQSTDLHQPGPQSSFMCVTLAFLRNIAFSPLRIMFFTAGLSKVSSWLDSDLLMAGVLD